MTTNIALLEKIIKSQLTSLSRSTERLLRILMPPSKRVSNPIDLSPVKQFIVTQSAALQRFIKPRLAALIADIKLRWQSIDLTPAKQWCKAHIATLHKAVMQQVRIIVPPTQRASSPFDLTPLRQSLLARYTVWTPILKQRLAAMLPAPLQEAITAIDWTPLHRLLNHLRGLLSRFASLLSAIRRQLQFKLPARPPLTLPFAWHDIKQTIGAPLVKLTQASTPKQHAAPPPHEPLVGNRRSVPVDEPVNAPHRLCRSRVKRHSLAATTASLLSTLSSLAATWGKDLDSIIARLSSQTKRLLQQLFAALQSPERTEESRGSQLDKQPTPTRLSRLSREFKQNLHAAAPTAPRRKPDYTMNLLNNVRLNPVFATAILTGGALLGSLYLTTHQQKPLLHTMLDRTDAFLHDLHSVPQKRSDFIAVEAYASFDPRPKDEEDSQPQIAETIKKGETFDTSLRRQNVATDVRLSIIDALRDKLDFKRIKPKDNYTLQLDDNGALASFSYESSPLDILTIKNSDNGYQVSKAAVELERKKIKVTGEIASSLFAAFAANNEDMRLLFAFADIFASKIDFNTEIQPGDRFCLVVDKYYKNGELVGYGKIEAAQYHRTNGATLEAYLHSSPAGKEAYYDQKGLTVGTSFLRSPVPVGKVSSNFTYQRRHPISGQIKPHLGIDLSAPVGTPIMAVADGKIIDLGSKGGFGNQIVIAHNGDFKTYYGHLASFKKGLKRGSLVSKKDIIGYVGSTGTSTGPHIDYRLQQHTVFKDPFSMSFKAEIALTGKELREFKQEVQAMDTLADFASFTPLPQVLKVSNLTITKDHNITLL